MGRRKESPLAALRTPAVTYACPKCYRQMDGLECSIHGEFTLCRKCGAAQVEGHSCLADIIANLPVEEKKPRKPPVIKTRKTCVICSGKKEGVPAFCSMHKKWQSRYYHNRKKGMENAENIDLILSQYEQHDRIQRLIDSSAEVDLAEVLAG